MTVIIIRSDGLNFFTVNDRIGVNQHVSFILTTSVGQTNVNVPLSLKSLSNICRKRFFMTVNNFVLVVLKQRL